MLTEYGWDTCSPSASRVCNVTAYDPTAFGVPLTVPGEFVRVRPGGRVPETRYHVYGVVPPIAARFTLYCTLALPLGKAAVVIFSGGTSVTVACAYFEESATLVARTATDCCEVMLPGVYTPVFEIVPVAGLTDQVTPVLAVQVTEARNCCVAIGRSVVVVGLTVTVTQCDERGSDVRFATSANSMKAPRSGMEIRTIETGRRCAV